MSDIEDLELGRLMREAIICGFRVDNDLVRAMQPRFGQLLQYGSGPSDATVETVDLLRQVLDSGQEHTDLELKSADVLGVRGLGEDRHGLHVGRLSADDGLDPRAGVVGVVERHESSSPSGDASRAAATARVSLTVEAHADSPPLASPSVGGGLS